MLLRLALVLALAACLVCAESLREAIASSLTAALEGTSKCAHCPCAYAP